MSQKFHSNASLHQVFDVTLDANPVTVTVVIGDGQLGGSSIMLDSTILPNPEPVTSFPIGNGIQVENKILQVTTTVSKYSPSDHASVIVTISQGATKNSYWHEDTFTSDRQSHDKIIFSLSYLLI